MPETQFTRLCNHYWDLIQRVRRELIETEVLPKADEQLMSRPAVIRQRDNVYKVPFIRILRWLHTFDKLNGDMHVQAIGAGARAIYELYIDLRWFDAHRDEIYLDRFRQYSDVDRYLTAKKVIDRMHDAKSGLTNQVAQPILERMKSLDDKAKAKGFASFNDFVIRFWGRNRNGEPNWPGHWSGEGNLKARAAKLGDECLDQYYLIYPMLCALVHPGPTAEVGVELSDPVWRERLVSFSYQQTYFFARRSTDLFVDLVGIRQFLGGYSSMLQKLDTWEQDAYGEAP